MLSGTYAIVNIITQDFYVGSAYDLKARKRIHFKALKNNRHCNSRLQRAFNEHGESNFRFVVLLTSSKDKVKGLEQQLLDQVWGKPFTYNICGKVNTTCPVVRGPMSEATKAKIGKSNSVALRGRKLTNEITRKKLCDYQRTRPRKPFTQEAKDKMSAAKLGKPAPWNSHPKSEETKRKISETKRRANGTV